MKSQPRHQTVMSIASPRSAYVELSDAVLRSQCAVDTYRASGPGGQKRNKTSSAVRLRHLPTGLIVIAEESRSQHENRVRALRRLREALYLQLREAWIEGSGSSEENAGKALPVTKKDPVFWPIVARCLDAMTHTKGSVRDAAGLLGTTTGQFVAFLSISPKAWQAANQLREEHGLKLLRLDT